MGIMLGLLWETGMRWGYINFGPGIVQSESCPAGSVFKGAVDEPVVLVSGLTGCLGVYSCRILSQFLPWRPLSIIFSILCAPLVISILWMPESPVFLLSRKREDEAHRMYLRKSKIFRRVLKDQVLKQEIF